MESKFSSGHYYIISVARYMDFYSDADWACSTIVDCDRTGENVNVTLCIKTQEGEFLSYGILLRNLSLWRGYS